MTVYNEQDSEKTRIVGNGNTMGDESSPQIIKAEGGSTIQNVTQAVIHLSPWAWIGGIGILAFTALLVAGLFNIGLRAANEQLPKALAGSLGYHQGSAEKLVDNVVIALEGALDPAIIWAAARALLRRKDELTRRLAIRLLGSLRVPQAIPSLKRIVRAEEGLLRSEAARALDQISRAAPGHG